MKAAMTNAPIYKCTTQEKKATDNETSQQKDNCYFAWVRFVVNASQPSVCLICTILQLLSEMQLQCIYRTMTNPRNYHLERSLALSHKADRIFGLSRRKTLFYF